VRAIDHVVLPVTTLTLARSRLAGLGFVVAPDARHPFGTANCCVFFRNRSYLEPITIQDRDAADEAAANGVYFVRRIKRFTEQQGEGMAMVALKSGDAEADRRAWDQAGIGTGDTFQIRRRATLANGSTREVGFATAYADIPDARHATIFVCQHLNPEELFQPDYLTHPNTTIGIESATAVANDPARFDEALVAIDEEGLRALPNSDVQGAPRGQTISIVTPEVFRERYDATPPDPRQGMVFAAVDLAVGDLETAAKHIGSAARRHDNRLILPPAPGLGAAMAFFEAGHA
jgi:hypothetical protein